MASIKLINKFLNNYPKIKKLDKGKETFYKRKTAKITR